MLKTLSMACAGALAAGMAAASGAAPAWRPADRGDLQALVRCEAVIDAEIARRGARLDRAGGWTILHQAVWRLEAERALLRDALRATMDADSAEAARAALLPDGPQALSRDARRRVVRNCKGLVDAVHAAGDAQGDAYAALPRVAFPGAPEASRTATR